MIASYYRSRISPQGSDTGCHTTLYISFNKRRRLVSEELVSLTGIIQGANSGLPAPRAKMLPLLYAPFVSVLERSPPCHAEISVCPCPAVDHSHCHCDMPRLYQVCQH